MNSSRKILLLEHKKDYYVYKAKILIEKGGISYLNQVLIISADNS